MMELAVSVYVVIKRTSRIKMSRSQKLKEIFEPNLIYEKLANLENPRWPLPPYLVCEMLIYN